VVTRAEIQKALWPDGRFVEFEHAINTAVKKVREALGDDPENPKFIETLPKLGYRFSVAVQEAARPSDGEHPHASAQLPGEFSIPHPGLSRFLFLLIQIGYLSVYCSTLYYLPALENALGRVGFVPVSVTFPGVLVLAMCGIAVRLYLLTAVGWRHPAAGAKFLHLFPFILILDALWSASPLLAIESVGPGVALAGVAGMAYLPFAQRTLVKGIYKISAATPQPSASHRKR
jgi:hypothetical protein